MRTCYYPQQSHLITAVFPSERTKTRPEPSLIKQTYFLNHIRSPSYHSASVSNRRISFPTHHLVGTDQSPPTTPTSPRAATLPNRRSNPAPRALPTYLISRPHACTADRLASGRENFQGSRSAPNKSICGPKHPANRRIPSSVSGLVV